MEFNDENLDFTFAILNNKIKYLGKDFTIAIDICKNKKEEKEVFIKYISDCIKAYQNVLQHINDMEVEE